MRTFGDLGEDELHICAILGRHFIECDLVLLCVLESFLFGDLAFLLHVGLVAHQHDHHLTFAVLLYR